MEIKELGAIDFSLPVDKPIYSEIDILVEYDLFGDKRLDSWIFGSGRSNGRKHAGHDFYVAEGREVYALVDGVVLAKRLFYRGTYQVIVKSKDFIWRYCELSPSKHIDKGVEVKAGECIGYVAKMEGIIKTMLHLETYDRTRFSKEKYSGTYLTNNIDLDDMDSKTHLLEKYGIKGDYGSFKRTIGLLNTTLLMKLWYEKVFCSS